MNRPHNDMAVELAVGTSSTCALCLVPSDMFRTGTRKNFYISSKSTLLSDWNPTNGGLRQRYFEMHIHTSSSHDGSMTLYKIAEHITLCPVMPYTVETRSSHWFCSIESWLVLVLNW